MVSCRIVPDGGSLGPSCPLSLYGGQRRIDRAATDAERCFHSPLFPLAGRTKNGGFVPGTGWQLLVETPAWIGWKLRSGFHPSIENGEARG